MAISKEVNGVAVATGHSPYLTRDSDARVCWPGLSVGPSGIAGINVTIVLDGDVEFVPLVPVLPVEDKLATCLSIPGLGGLVEVWTGFRARVSVRSVAVRA